MRTKLSLLKPLCAAAMLCAAAAAQADITVYTSEAAFLAAVTAPGVDTYDDLTTTLYADTLHRSAGGYTYDAYSLNGLYGAGGTGGDHWLSNDMRTDPIVFSHFSGGVRAFGGNFFPSDVFGQFAPGDVTLTADDGGTLVYNLSNATPTGFLGFISTSALVQVTLGTDGVHFWPTANNVVLAAPVPEPASYAMLLAGLGFVGVVSRRRC